LTTSLPFDAAEIDKGATEPTFVVDVEGFEGPLDLLLELARRQKVDLAKISVLQLAEQYLAFVEEARRVRLELAADYLVMAAWLAYLKSRLLLPDQNKSEEPDAADLAQRLAERLQQLQLIRLAAERLVNRPRLGRDIFLRGAPEEVETTRKEFWRASLFDLLSAYARQRQKNALAKVTVKKREVWSIAEARAALDRLVGVILEWTPLDGYLLQYCADPAHRRTARASAFASSLEMVKEGLIDLRQDTTFAPLWVRTRPTQAAAGHAALEEP
jgi:segregation and condensation protein A